MPLFGWSVGSLWPTSNSTPAGVTTADRHEPRGGVDRRSKTAREAASRVNKKSPMSPPPSESGTTPAATATTPSNAPTSGGAISGILRMNSWGRGGGGGGVGVGSHRAIPTRALRPKKKKMSSHHKNLMDLRFQDPGTASTLSMMTPSEAELSCSSSSFFFMRSQRSSSFRHSATSPPPPPSTTPMPPSTPAERFWVLPQRDSPPLHEEEDDGDADDVGEVPRPVIIMDEDGSESSSHSTLCPVPPPTSPSSSLPLLDESSTSCLVEDSYDLQRNDRRELGFMSFQFTAVDEALAMSRRLGKPVLCYHLSTSDAARGRALEVAASVWSHPLLVEAAQSLFVTACCGPPREDPTAPSLSSPSLDILDASGSPIVPTLVASASSSSSSCLSSSSCDSETTSINRRTVTRAMVMAMERHLAPWPVPRYLSLLHEEEEAGGRGELAVLGTDDPILAEIELAGLAGVVATRSGSIDQQQRVVEVTYDPKRISFGCVARFALKRKVANVVFHRTNDERVSAHVEIERLREVAVTKPFEGTIQPDFDPKPALRRTPLRFVPLTSLQATRANRLVHLGRFNEAVHLLSPKQGLILMRTMHTSAQKDLHDVIEVPILPAWISVCDKRHPRHAVEQVCSCDDPACDFENPPSYYEYNCYSTDRLPPGYPWRGF